MFPLKLRAIGAPLLYDEKLEEIRIEREQLEVELKEGMQDLQDAGLLRIEDLRMYSEFL